MKLSYNPNTAKNLQEKEIFEETTMTRNLAIMALVIHEQAGLPPPFHYHCQKQETHFRYVCIHSAESITTLLWPKIFNSLVR